MESGLILLTITGFGFMATYHCFRYKNTYWIYPTITGFRDRKKPCESKLEYVIVGLSTGFSACVVAAYTGYYFWQIIAYK